MSKCDTFRVFTGALENASNACEEVRKSISNELHQLQFLQLACNPRVRGVEDPAVKMGGAIVVVSRANETSTSSEAGPYSQLDRATFAIPVVEIPGPQQLGRNDIVTIKCSDNAIDNISIDLGNRDAGDLANKNILSAGCRHTGVIDVRLANKLPENAAELRLVMFKPGDMRTPVNCRWLVINVMYTAPTKDAAYPQRSVPFFDIKIDRQKGAERRAVMSEMERSELMRVDRTAPVIPVCNVGVFFDSVYPTRLTPIVADAIERSFATSVFKTLRTDDAARIIYAPFISIKNKETHYKKVVFVAPPREAIAGLLAGLTGAGDLSVQSTTIGEIVDHSEVAKGRLYYKASFHPLTIKEDVATLVNFVRQAAANVGVDTRTALNVCARAFEENPIGIARRSLQSEGALRLDPEGVDKVYLYWYLNRTFNAPILSNLDQVLELKHAFASASASEPVDDWEMEAAGEMGGELKYPELAAQLRLDYAHNTDTIDDIVKTIRLDQNTETFALTDRRLMRDQITPQMMLASFLCSATNETCEFRYDCPPVLGGQVRDIILKRISDLNPVRKTMDFGGKTITFPYEKEAKDFKGTAFAEAAARKPRPNLHCITISFYRGSGDIARILAMMHVFNVTLGSNEISVFVGPKSLRPPEDGYQPSLSSLKYKVGTDPRCTPTWDMASYENSLKLMAEARIAAMNHINAHQETGKRRIGVVEVAGRVDMADFTKFAERCIKSGSFADVKTVADVNMISLMVMPLKNPTLSASLTRRKLELIAEYLRALETRIVAASTLTRQFYRMQKEKDSPVLTDAEKREWNDANKLMDHCYSQVITYCDAAKYVDDKGIATTNFFNTFANGALMAMYHQYQRNAQQRSVQRRTQRMHIEETTDAAMGRFLALASRFKPVAQSERDWAAEIKRDEGVRYTDLCVKISRGEMISFADHLWAIAYELRHPNGGNAFRNIAVANQKRQARVTQLNMRVQFATQKILGSEWTGRIVKYINRVTEDQPTGKHADQVVRLLCAIRHCVTQPNFRVESFDSTANIWANSSNFDDFYKWSKECGFPCSAVLGEIDWNRQGASERAFETIQAYILDLIRSRTVHIDMDINGDMDDQGANWNPLASQFTDDQLHAFNKVVRSRQSISTEALEALIQKALRENAYRIKQELFGILLDNSMLQFTKVVQNDAMKALAERITNLRVEYETKTKECEAEKKKITARLAELTAMRAEQEASHVLAADAYRDAEAALNQARADGTDSADGASIITEKSEALAKARKILNHRTTNLKDTTTAVERVRAERERIMTKFGTNEERYARESELCGRIVDGVPVDYAPETLADIYVSIWVASAARHTSLIDIEASASRIADKLKNGAVSLVAAVMILIGQHVICPSKETDQFADDASVMSSELGIGSLPEQPAQPEANDGTEIKAILRPEPIFSKIHDISQSGLRSLWTMRVRI